MGERKYYVQELIRQPADLWHLLLSYALEAADTVEFVVPKDITKWSLELRRLLPYLTAVHTSKWRWQSKQLTRSTFVRFQLTGELRTYLRSVERLEQWVDQYPEDPAVYRDDQAILWTISHDGMAFLWLSEEEVMSLNQSGCNLYPIEDTSLPTRKSLG